MTLNSNYLHVILFIFALWKFICLINAYFIDKLGNATSQSGSKPNESGAPSGQNTVTTPPATKHPVTTMTISTCTSMSSGKTHVHHSSSVPVVQSQVHHGLNPITPGTDLHHRHSSGNRHTATVTSSSGIQQTPSGPPHGGLLINYISTSK